jgi:hypothetical protein
MGAYNESGVDVRRCASFVELHGMCMSPEILIRLKKMDLML